MDTLSRYHIELMDYSRVHVTISVPSWEESDVGRHYERTSLADNSRIEELHQKARAALLAPGEREELGEKLFQMLFDEAAQSKFLDVYNYLRESNHLPLHIELTIDEVALPDLAALPWEFLRLPLREQQSAIWLSANPHLCFARKPLQHGNPLTLHLEPNEKMRIAVIIADALPGAPVRAGSIVELLNTLAKCSPEALVSPEVIGEGTRKNILRELRLFCPHLVHFIGHARFTKQMVGQVALVDEVPSGQPDWISAEQFGELFDPVQPGLKVIVLQACESAVNSPASAFSGVAAHVLSHRIPAVVAMQYEISNMTAECFATAFYEKLLKSGSIDQAVQEARFAINAEIEPIGQYNYYGYFATPVLFRRANDGQMLVRRGNISTAISPEMMAVNGYKAVKSHLPQLKEMEQRCTQETTLARDRCMQYHAMLVQLHQDLSSLYELLDSPAPSMPRIEYASLFGVSEVTRKVQALIDLLADFCPFCPPPMQLSSVVYRKRKSNITTEFRDVVAQMQRLDHALQRYYNQCGLVCEELLPEVSIEY